MLPNANRKFSFAVFAGIAYSPKRTEMTIGSDISSYRFTALWAIPLVQLFRASDLSPSTCSGNTLGDSFSTVIGRHQSRADGSQLLHQTNMILLQNTQTYRKNHVYRRALLAVLHNFATDHFTALISSCNRLISREHNTTKLCVVSTPLVSNFK